MATLENQWPYQNKSLTDMKGEIWREVPGFDGDLVVSNYGRVKVLSRFIVHRNAPDGFWTKERIKVQSVIERRNTYKGDITVHLSCVIKRAKRQMNLSVRRLVYQAFVDKDLERKNSKVWFVYVKDGNGFNCRAENLALISSGEAKLREIQEGRRLSINDLIKKEAHWQNYQDNLGNRAEPVKQYDLTGNFIAIYPSCTAAAKATGIGRTSIGASARKTFYMAGGFVWRFECEEYNGEYAKRHLGRKKPVLQLNKQGEMLGKYESLTVAARVTGISIKKICYALNSKALSETDGYLWKYSD
ncbi:NUMOD1 domain-containing DNA-binding protein [Chitinophaga sp. 30R24]|uniref:NUMOD1 domain-containing DNA-binding protein n=1 Tax=Chitinophaga sp. 30R24 TaxID=3248838 RepID=UPI003B914D42